MGNMGRMALIEIRRGEYVDDEEIEDPSCIRQEQFDSKRFHDYIMAKLEFARDAVSKDIRAAMGQGRSLGDAVLDAIEAFPESQTKRLREWVEEARGTHIYAYADVGDNSVSCGLMKTMGGPRDKFVSNVQLHVIEFERRNYWQFVDALSEVESNVDRYTSLHGGSLYLSPELKREAEESSQERRRAIRNIFYDENGFVEIESKSELARILEATGYEGKWSWEKPGIYDFRDLPDSPPTFYETLEDFVRNEERYEAEQALEDMFQDIALESICAQLLDE